MILLALESHLATPSGADDASTPRLNSTAHCTSSSMENREQGEPTNLAEGWGKKALYLHSGEQLK